MPSCGRLLHTLAAVLTLTAAAAVVQPVASAPRATLAQVTLPTDIAPTDAENEGPLPNRLMGQVGLDERLGSRVPTDLTFLDETGRPAQLSALLAGGKPVMLAFVYHNCPMLCGLTLDGVAEAVAATDLRVGEDYEVLAVSMDPRDTPARADSAEARVVRLIGDPAAAGGLHFWTIPEGGEDPVQRLADAVGFRYAFDPVTEEYAHGAAVVFLSPEGVVTRYLYGVTYPPRDVRLALVEAGQGTVGTTLDRFLLTCFEFDEDARSYTLAVLNVMKLGGGLLLLVFGGLMVTLWRREARRQREAPLSPDAAPAP